MINKPFVFYMSGRHFSKLVICSCFDLAAARGRVRCWCGRVSDFLRRGSSHEVLTTSQRAGVRPQAPLQEPGPSALLLEVVGVLLTSTVRGRSLLWTPLTSELLIGSVYTGGYRRAVPPFHTLPGSICLFSDLGFVCSLRCRLVASRGLGSPTRARHRARRIPWRCSPSGHGGCRVSQGG